MATPAARPRPPFYQDPEFFRPQTWLLLLALLSYVLCFFVPLLYWHMGPGQTFSLGLTGISTLPAGLPIPPRLQFGLWLIAGCMGLAALCVLIILTRYRHRRQQLRLARVALLLAVIALVYAVYNLIFAVDTFQLGGVKPTVAYTFGSALPVLPIILVLFAQPMIRKDELSIKSMNRFW